MLPYGRQCIDDDDIRAVVESLNSDFITTGPRVAQFERDVCDFTGASNAIALSSGTAALHCMMTAIGIKKGDEVIVPAMTFAASSNAVLYQAGTPVFADVSPDTLLINPESVESMITKHTKAILAVDYAGQPCDYDSLRIIADRHGVMLLSDACHSLGAKYKGTSVGSLADATALSFHPVKQITTGEGGMVLCNKQELAEHIRLYRNHGISTDYRQREEQGAWFYEMVELGFNYRITDFQCALGSSQLKKLPAWLDRRRQIAKMYDTIFSGMDSHVEPLKVNPHILHSYHLYVLKIKGGRRDKVFSHLRSNAIGSNVHYIPVHLHPYYKRLYGCLAGLCPVSENAFKQILTIPIMPLFTDSDVEFVASTVREAIEGKSK